MSSSTSKLSKVNLDSNSGWNVAPRKETDTAILRYNRIAMLETVLSIRDRKRQLISWSAAAMLVFAGGLVIAAGVLGWLS